jgi:hypothetical protein
VNERSEYGDANLKINYKYIDEFNKISEMKLPFNNYCRLLSSRFNNLVKLLKSDMEVDPELKKVVIQVNSMIIQLDKSLIIEKKMCGDEH